MSTPSLNPTEAIAKLPAEVQRLVTNASSKLPGNTSFGSSEAESKEIEEWLGVAAGVKGEEDLKGLNEKLLTKTYLVGTSPSAADIALYATIHPIYSTLPSSTYLSLPALTRYIDHIQSLPSVQSSTPPSTIAFDFSNAPKIERTVEVKKKEKKTAAAAPDAASAAPAATTSTPAEETVAPPQNQKQSKKDKKAAVAAGGEGAPKKEKKAAPAPAPAADAGEPSPSMIDLRVGKIIEVARHPDADGLYVEQIDIGEETGPRTVVSGLVNYMPITELQNRTIIVVANLKPASMRGVKSFAMVLCATHKDGKEHGIEFVEPPEGSVPGTRVFFDGDKYRDELPVPQLNPKKKVFETIQPGFTTLENRDAAWVDPATGTAYRIMTKDGVCRPKNFVGASLS